MTAKCTGHALLCALAKSGCCQIDRSISAGDFELNSRRFVQAPQFNLEAKSLWYPNTTVEGNRTRAQGVKNPCGNSLATKALLAQGSGSPVSFQVMNIVYLPR